MNYRTVMLTITVLTWKAIAGRQQQWARTPRSIQRSQSSTGSVRTNTQYQL